MTEKIKTREEVKKWALDTILGKGTGFIRAGNDQNLMMAVLIDSIDKSSGSANKLGKKLNS